MHPASEEMAKENVAVPCRERNLDVLNNIDEYSKDFELNATGVKVL